MSGPVPVELGKQTPDGKDAQATTVGLVSGLGTFGAVAQGPVTGVVAQMFGWSQTFWFMFVLASLSAFALLTPVLSLLKQKKSQPEEQNQQPQPQQKT